MEFNKSRLFELSNRRMLADMLRVDKDKFKKSKIDLEFQPYKLPDHLSIVNGKKRNLYNPEASHKRALKRLVDLLSIDLPQYVYGGIKGKSHICNAAVHKDKEYMMLIDIKDFFPTTSDKYVYKLFREKFKMTKDLSEILTNFVTVPSEIEGRMDRYLPQGYPTSPILSYLSYSQMYDKLEKLSIDNNMEFSCYYDDLSFSSDKFIPKTLKRECARIIAEYNFKIHPEKSKVFLKKAAEVTGVFLDGSGEIKPTKKLLSKLQSCYECTKQMDKNSNDFTQQEFVDILSRFQGLITAVKSIQKDKNLELYSNQLKYIRKKYEVPYKNERQVIYQK